MRKLREDDEENFRRELSRTMIGPKKYDTPAPIYNYSREVLTFEQFRTIMMSLPEYVDDGEVKSMFAHADKDGNGFISYKEFTLMCKVPDQEAIPAVPIATTTVNSNGTVSSTVASMTSSVVNAVNGALKGAAASSASTATTAVAGASSAAPVNTVVTVTSTKS